MSMFVVIVGGGKIGSYLASLLLADGHQVRVVDCRPDVLARLREELPNDVIIVGDGSKPEILEAAGIRQANVLAAVTGEDEANLVVTTLARFEYNVPRVIARVNNPKNAWAFNAKMGVDAVVNQAEVLAKAILEDMSMGDMMTLLKLRRGEYSLIEEKAHPQSPAVGQAVRDLKLPAESTLVAVLRHGDLIVPHGDTVIEPMDEIFALVHQSQLATLAALLGKPE